MDWVELGNHQWPSNMLQNGKSGMEVGYFISMQNPIRLFTSRSDKM